MAIISFSYTSGTGVLEVDMDQLKGALESGTIAINPEALQIGGTEIIDTSRNIADGETSSHTIGTVSKTAVKSDTVVVTQTATTGAGLAVSRNLASGSTNTEVCSITNSSATDDQITLALSQASPSRALYAVMTNDSASASIKLTHTSEGADSNYCLFSVGGDANRRTAYFERNLTSAATGTPVVAIIQNNAGDDQAALAIQQDVTTIEAIDFLTGSIAFDFAAAMVSTGAGTAAVNNSPGAGASTWVKVEVNGTAGYMLVHYAA